MKLPRFVIAMVLFIGGVAVFPAPGQQLVHGQPVARIDDQAVYEEDLQPIIAGQLLQLRNREYELKSKALEALLRQRLVETDAKKKGLSVEALFEQVERNQPPWDMGELQGFYLAQRERFNKPLAEIKQDVEKAFLAAKRQQAREEYVDKLWQTSGVVVLIARPKVELAVDPARLRSDPDAPVTIVEFADFQCPHCRTVEPVLTQVIEKYKGKVRLGFRDFPLRSIHPQAQAAAEASRCAAEQGKFWEYHEALFANQTRLNPDTYRELARSAGLDRERFDACLTSGKFTAQIESDVQSAIASGVSGTPAFYINGVALAGSQPAAAFERIIESELKRLASSAPAR